MRKKRMTPKQREAARIQIVEKYSAILKNKPSQKQMDRQKAFMKRLQNQAASAVAVNSDVIDRAIQEASK